MSDNITLPREVVERLVASWGRDTEGFYGSMDILRTALAAEPTKPEPVAWLYKGEPWFDGDCWHDNYQVTTSKQVAKFKDKNAQPLYATEPQKPSEDIEALRRDAEKWRKARAKYIAWQKGGKAEAMEDER